MTTILEYIWIDSKNNCRSKTRCVYKVYLEKIVLSDIEDWNYDGSSTNQANGIDSEVILKPCKLLNDPIRKNNSYLVLCDTYNPDGTPLDTNNRHRANNLFLKKQEEQPWFGLEQEFFLINPKTNKPLGFPKDINANPPSQGQYYCSIGTQNSFGRPIIEEHLLACIEAGIKISGINSEVAPGQWEFQIGPSLGIDAGDDLWVARYLLTKIAEKHNIIVSYHPKPLDGDWNGSGCHTNYSTKKMREGDDKKIGLEYINEAITKLSKNHSKHMKVYGTDNDKRMTGKHETASFYKFTDGVANRGYSIRRGNLTVTEGKGYFEDRRPSSNCDPYLVTSIIFETTCLNE